MTLKECYDALGGNYEDTVRRLYNEKLVEKFLFKFEEDPSFENLKKALEEENLESYNIPKMLQEDLHTRERQVRRRNILRKTAVLLGVLFFIVILVLGLSYLGHLELPRLFNLHSLFSL